jgi:hypothetical protein
VTQAKGNTATMYFSMAIMLVSFVAIVFGIMSMAGIVPTN